VDPEAIEKAEMGPDVFDALEVEALEAPRGPCVHVEELAQGHEALVQEGVEHAARLVRKAERVAKERNKVRVCEQGVGRVLFMGGQVVDAARPVKVEQLVLACLSAHSVIFATEAYSICISGK
jgi:hypothetical protein